MKEILKSSYKVSNGLHPWYYHTLSLSHCEEKLRELVVLPNVAAIGETGLDINAKLSLKDQLPYFELHLKIGIEFKRPIIIHCVRAYYDLISICKNYPVSKVIHGFSGNTQIAEKLVQEGFILSFGAGLFKNKIGEIFHQLPTGTFLLETDIAAHIHIGDIYDKAAELRKVSREIIEKECDLTFRKHFNLI